MLIRGRPAANQDVANRLDYLKSSAAMNEQLALASNWTGLLAGRESYDLKIAAKRTEFLHYYTSAPARTAPDPFQLRLWMRASPKGPRILVDTVKVTLKKTEDLWWLGSARGIPTAMQRFLLDDHETQMISSYPIVEHISGPPPDSNRSQFVVFVHGYNVSTDGAAANANEVFRRLFWAGYRGNFAAITWEGNEGTPLHFADNVQNASQTSPSFLRFLDNVVYGSAAGGWGADPQNVVLFAHSLGNQVVLDALRMRSGRIGFGPVLLGRSFVLAEAAVWSETFWPEAPVAYPESNPPVTYSVGDLKSHSWCFWYNQTQHPALAAVGSAYHTYNPGDSMLWWMLKDDVVKRNYGKHVDRDQGAGPFGRRVALPFDEPQDPPRHPLTYLPTMFKPGSRNVVWDSDNRLWLFDIFSINEPLGRQPNPQAGHNMDASTKGSPPTAHSGFKDTPLPIVWPWWQWLIDAEAVRKGKE